MDTDERGFGSDFNHKGTKLTKIESIQIFNH
jgi:hypothetical protein